MYLHSLTSLVKFDHTGCHRDFRENRYVSQFPAMSVDKTYSVTRAIFRDSKHRSVGFELFRGCI